MFPSLSATGRAFLVAALLAVALPSLSANLDPKLDTALGAAKPSDLLSVIVTYNAQPTPLEVASLRTLGIKYGVVLQQLPMVGVWATPAQIGQIAARPAV